MAAPLLERAAEAAVVEETLEAARAGAGAIVVIEGPAGIGKTALLDLARRRAQALGMRTLIARCSVLERELGHGVARQLLEPALRGEGEVGGAA